MTKSYKKLSKRIGILTVTLPIVVVLLLLKAGINYYGLPLIPLNSLVTALLSGVFFTIGILFAGAVSDYKEAEKIPSELVVAIKTLNKDIRVIPIDEKQKAKMHKHVLELLQIINLSFRRNRWKLREIDPYLDQINEDIRELGEKNVTPNFLIKLRTELTNIDKMCHRIDVIQETTFIPAAYTIAETSISIMVLILLFIQTDLVYAEYLIIGATSSILIGMLMLIKDIDNPFEYKRNSHADVDLSMLFNLEKYLTNTQKN